MKHPILHIVIIVLTSILLVGHQRVKAQTASRPNVLFIAVDDLRSNDGNFAAITPNIDRLAKKGVVFNRAYCQQAVCGPSRASVLTGRRPDVTKVWDLKTHFRQALPDAVTLPQYFKQHGYAARNVGKIYHDSKEAQDPVSWSAPEIKAITDAAGPKYVLPENQPTNGSWKKASWECLEVPDTAYVDGQVARAAVNVIRELKDSSFFLAVGFRRPHLPFSAPKRYWDLYNPREIPLPSPDSAPEAAPKIALHDGVELRGYNDIPDSGAIPVTKIQQLRHGYYASISYIDAQIGRLIDELEQQGLMENTVIVLWSDHGFHLGELGLWAKTTNFEMDTRVPLIICSPQVGVKESNTEALVELIDIYPTLAELAGLAIPDELEGKSMVPLLKDPTRPWKKAAFSQFPRPWMYKNEPKYMGYSVRTKEYRYTEWVNMGDGAVESKELYHYSPSTLEKRNLAGSKEHSRIEKSMMKLLKQGRKLRRDNE